MVCAVGRWAGQGESCLADEAGRPGGGRRAGARCQPSRAAATRQHRPAGRLVRPRRPCPARSAAPPTWRPARPPAAGRSPIRPASPGCAARGACGLVSCTSIRSQPSPYSRRSTVRAASGPVCWIALVTNSETSSTAVSARYPSRQAATAARVACRASAAADAVAGSITCQHPGPCSCAAPITAGTSISLWAGIIRRSSARGHWCGALRFSAAGACMGEASRCACAARPPC